MNGLFSHTLTDLIRGIRQNKKNEQAYIAKEIADIRLELRRNDPDLKAQAIAKLTYVRCNNLYSPINANRSQRRPCFNKLRTLDCTTQKQTNNACLFFLAFVYPAIAPNDGLRYVMGFFPCCRGHVVAKVLVQRNRISWSHSVLRPGDRCPHAHDKPYQEGRNVVSIIKEYGGSIFHADID